ncbi:hypothetical protein [Aquimarina rubra]|uniref:Uncharacterized protein n=1 Tax=Aquimarina rubra TaxID=1920033 RepID=A0ABW5LAA0_9FLAO
MKNNRRKKLSLDKIKVARLTHLDKFKGGSQDTTSQQSNEDDYCTQSLTCETVKDCVSTKTTPIGATSVCLI